MDKKMTLLEETVRMCDSTLERLKTTPGRADSLLDVVRQLRTDTLVKIAQLRRTYAIAERNARASVISDTSL